MKILLILVFVSCASYNQNEESYVERVKDEDFKEKPAKVYKKAQDKVAVKSKKLQDEQILHSESLDRGKLYDEVGENNELIDLAEACYESDFTRAKKLIKALQAQYRSNIIYWNQVGSCLLLEGEYRKALLFYNKALDFDKSYAPVLNNIGVLHQRKGEYEQALISFKNAIKANKYSRTPKFNAALLYLKFKVYNEAVRLLKGLQNYNKKDWEVQKLYGLALLMAGNPRSALALLEQTPNSEMDDPYWRLNLAYAKFLAGDTKGAQRLFKDIDVDRGSVYANYYQKIGKEMGYRQ